MSVEPKKTRVRKAVLKPEPPAENPHSEARAADLAAARESFADFCALIDIPQAPLKSREALDDEGEEAVYRPIQREPADHLVLLQDALQKVEAGEITRLMVFMPPGGAKSTYCSVCFPPWFLGRKARRNVILCTYAGGLARKHGRRARSVVRQPVFKQIFGLGMSRETGAADEWSLDNGNEFMAGGIRAGITGNRADLLLIDDPIKGREEADSRTIRERTWEEFKDSLRTRLKPGGRIVIIQTRWHEDDLAGRLLPMDYDGQSGWVDGRDGEKWFVISIPAEADRDDDPLGRAKGQLFWPQWFPAEHWAPFKLEPRTWNALYQQKPKPDEGDYFQRGWFKRFDRTELPAGVRYVITCDFAVKPGGGDYTCHLVWAIDGHMGVWLVDIWRGQTASDIWIEALLDLVADYRDRGGGPVRVYGEAGVIWRAISPMLGLRMRERGVLTRAEAISSQMGDKAARARGFQAMARAGRVKVVDTMDGDIFIEELVGFPGARWDDQVDAAGLFARSLDKVSRPRRGDRPDFAEGGEVW
jgi:hypothetical protein